MKKFLVLLFAVSLSVSGFATNAWNKPLGKAAFDDPYVDNFNVSVIGTQGYPNYALLVQADFNQTVGVPYYVVIEVPGYWAGIGSGYKQFTLYYSAVQWHKSLTYNMASYEVAYTELADIIDYGPQ